MNDTPKSKWYWRVLRWGLIGVAVLATLAAVIITEENWRAKHDWDAYRRAAGARGERLDIASVIPPPVPDDQNFFTAPVVVHALKADPCWTDFNIEPYYSTNFPTSGGSWTLGKLTDLKQWQHYFRTLNQTPEGKTNGFPIAAEPQTPAADVLLALSGFNSAIEELRQASQRPSARMPLDYEKGFEIGGDLPPWLAAEKQCALLLELRILAELQNGQGQQALDDVKLLLRLTDTMRNQPYLISHLVRLATMAIALEPIYEGLAQHRWNDAQLAELETMLAAKDFLADFRFAMRGECICAIDSLETQRLTREIKVDGAGEVTTISLRWVPSAFFYQNELAFARMYEQFELRLVDLTNRSVSLVTYHAGQQYIPEHTNHYSPYTVEALMTFPSVSRCVMKFAIIQVGVDLARVACALDRYHFAHGEYPVALDALAPQFIEKMPHDIINGQPLHYRRTDDGRFVLYSVGWNEKDDGGIVAPDKDGKMYSENGDWVWQYPAK